MSNRIAKLGFLLFKLNFVEPRNLVSISSTFYQQLLRAQIPNAQKDWKLYCLFALLGSARVKAASRTLVKLIPWEGLFSTGTKTVSHTIWGDHWHVLNLPSNLVQKQVECWESVIIFKQGNKLRNSWELAMNRKLQNI